MSSARVRAEAEWARTQERLEARTAVEALNDRALEVLVLAARAYSLVGAVTLTLIPLAVMLLGWYGAAASLVHVALVFGGGYWGWWYYGNDEWRGGRRDGG